MNSLTFADAFSNGSSSRQNEFRSRNEEALDEFLRFHEIKVPQRIDYPAISIQAVKVASERL